MSRCQMDHLPTKAARQCQLALSELDIWRKLSSPSVNFEETENTRKKSSSSKHWKKAHCAPWQSVELAYFQQATPIKREPILTRTVPEGCIAKTSKAMDNNVAESLIRRNRVAHLTWMEAAAPMTATTDPSGRRVVAHVVSGRTADGYLDEIGILTRAVSLETGRPYHRNFPTIWVFMVISIWMMASPSEEDAE